MDKIRGVARGGGVLTSLEFVSSINPLQTSIKEDYTPYTIQESRVDHGDRVTKIWLIQETFLT